LRRNKGIYFCIQAHSRWCMSPYIIYCHLTHFQIFTFCSSLLQPTQSIPVKRVHTHINTHTIVLQPFSWTTRVSQCQKKSSSGLYGASGDMKSRHIDNPAGLHSIRTNQWPTSLMPPLSNYSFTDIMKIIMNSSAVNLCLTRISDKVSCQDCDSWGTHLCVNLLLASSQIIIYEAMTNA